MSGLVKVARSAGWWWPFQHICVLTERPRVLRRDVDHRLHGEDGPAVMYPDGFAVYAWHGVCIPAKWITTPRVELDASLALTWPNIEQRRCLAEIVGWDRVLTQLSSVVVDENSDPTVGTLLEAQLPDSDEPARFLRIACATGRMFVLPVPRTCTTAREANAWTWDLPADQYAPEVQT